MTLEETTRKELEVAAADYLELIQGNAQGIYTLQLEPILKEHNLIFAHASHAWNIWSEGGNVLIARGGFVTPRGRGIISHELAEALSITVPIFNRILASFMPEYPLEM